MGKRKKLTKVPGTFDGPHIIQEGVVPGGLDEAGHVIVVTDHGLAMIVAGLRKIRVESPEVEPLLETLENALREGITARPDEIAEYGTYEQ